MKKLYDEYEGRVLPFKPRENKMKKTKKSVKKPRNEVTGTKAARAASRVLRDYRKAENAILFLQSYIWDAKIAAGSALTQKTKKRK